MIFLLLQLLQVFVEFQLLLYGLVNLVQFDLEADVGSDGRELEAVFGAGLLHLDVLGDGLQEALLRLFSLELQLPLLLRVLLVVQEHAVEVAFVVVVLLQLLIELLV